MRWESNIKMDLRKIGCEDGIWIELKGFGISGVI